MLAITETIGKPDERLRTMPAGQAVVVRGAVKSFLETDAEAAGGWRRLLGKPKKPLHAVRGIDMTVERGEIFGILGPNGSGKSTLIRLVSTLLIPDAGEVRVFGHDVTSETMAVRRLINRVSVEAAFFKKLSPMENLRYAARLYGLPMAEANARCTRIMERLGFPKNKLHSSLEDLSRGQQQKVAIARALMTSPVLLLLDEPTTGLDPKSKRDVQDFVLEVRREHDATVILTSHDMAESERLCDRVAFIDGGRFVAEGTPAELRQRFGGSLEDVFLTVTGKNWEEVEAQ